MNTMDLIKLAAERLRPYTDERGWLHGDVASAVISKNGEVYYGVCVDTSGWGLCAERSALAAMVTDGCYEIDMVVAVWRDDKTGKLDVLPPCGMFRHFMRELDERNLEADVILGKEDIKKAERPYPVL